VTDELELRHIVTRVESSSETAPVSTCCITAAAVNILVTDPILNWVSASTGSLPPRTLDPIALLIDELAVDDHRHRRAGGVHQRHLVGDTLVHDRREIGCLDRRSRPLAGQPPQRRTRHDRSAPSPGPHSPAEPRPRESDPDEQRMNATVAIAVFFMQSPVPGGKYADNRGVRVPDSRRVLDTGLPDVCGYHRTHAAGVAEW
jgi:hypothetical protein